MRSSRRIARGSVISRLSSGFAGSYAAQLDPQAKKLLERNADETTVPSHALSPESACRSMNELLISDEPGAPVGETTDWEIDGPSGAVPY